MRAVEDRVDKRGITQGSSAGVEVVGADFVWSEDGTGNGSSSSKSDW